MTNLKLKLTSAVVTGAFLAGVVLPTGAFAANTVTVSGNGSDSVNKVKIKAVKKSKVKQTNSATVINSVGVSQNTGGNKANKNTGGGDVNVNSGDATANVTITNTTGGNVLVMENCGCPEADNTVDVKDNGSDSVNKVKISSYSKNVVKQSNTAVITNGVNVGQNTGDNEANANTGDGAVHVDSGEANASVEITNTTGDNVLGPSNP